MNRANWVWAWSTIRWRRRRGVDETALPDHRLDVARVVLQARDEGLPSPVVVRMISVYEIWRQIFDSSIVS